MDDPTSDRPIDPFASAVSHAERPSGEATPWVTRAALTVCVGVFFGLTLQNDYSPAALARWGVVQPRDIWNGRYWPLVTSAFVHFDAWHIFFNMSVLWVLGSRMERAIGSLPYLAFYLAAAFVSASYQLATSGSTGIGASGALYGVFGFMWVARRWFPMFYEVIHPKNVRMFIGWLFACMVLTALDVLNIGNAAHVSGLLFGVGVGAAAAGRWRWPARAGLAALIVGAVVPLFWAPWLPGWIADGAQRAHEAKDYQRAVDLYSRYIDRRPAEAWAYWNRAIAYRELGDGQRARRDAETALELQPALRQLQEPRPHEGGDVPESVSTKAPWETDE